MADRVLTYFVSDVHLGLDMADPAGREDRFVEFLSQIPRERTEALYMLGDIWDFWYEYRDVVPKGYIRVFAQLMDLMDAGVKVYFFQGNHDLWCYHYFQDMGIQVLKQPYSVNIGGKDFCLGHGDGLGPGFRSYKFMRSCFHSRFLQALFSSLHPTIAFWMAKGWSASSRKKKWANGYVFRGEEEPLYKFALQWNVEHPTDYFIFGHFHTKVDMSLPSGARLLVLDSWLSHSDFLMYDGTSITGGHLPNTEK